MDIGTGFTKLLNVLERIANALEGAPAAVPTATPAKPKAAAPAKPKPTSKPRASAKKAAADGPTLDDVKEATRGVIAMNKREELREILTEFGATKTGELKPADYPAYLEKIKEISEEESLI